MWSRVYFDLNKFYIVKLFLKSKIEIQHPMIEETLISLLTTGKKWVRKELQRGPFSSPWLVNKMPKTLLQSLRAVYSYVFSLSLMNFQTSVT